MKYSRSRRAKLKRKLIGVNRVERTVDKSDLEVFYGEAGKNTVLHSGIVLEAMEFPDPVIGIAVEPKTQKDLDKLGVGLQKLAEEDWECYRP